MGEKRLPYTKLDLMHEVDDKHLRQIKIVTKFLSECVLSCTKGCVSYSTWVNIERALNSLALEQSK